MRHFPKNDKDRKVLFLDIDGILQPTDHSTHGGRFKLSLEERTVFSAKIADEAGIDHLRNLDPMDVAAVYLDWEKKAVENLKKILNCSKGPIEIVLSSGWRETRSFEDMKALFAIHGLDEYLTDMCPNDNFCSKERAVKLYLEQHPDLINYVVLDDENLLAYLPGHTVCCNSNWLDDRVMRQVKRIFEYGFWWEYRPLKEDDFFRDGIEQVIFLDIDGVLNSYRHGPLIDEDMVANLVHRVIQKTNAEIVITSSWRDELCRWAYNGFQESDDYWDCWMLIKALARYRISIADITPRIRNGPDGRPFEVRTWLAHHADVKSFVILDDEPFWEWGLLKDHVVETMEWKEDLEYTCGLTMEQADRAYEILLGLQTQFVKEHSWDGSRMNIFNLRRKNSVYWLSELQDATGIDKVLLEQYESGKRIPPTEALIALADYFGVSIDYVLGRTYEQKG